DGARQARRHGRVRPRHSARLRREDSGGLAAGRPEGSASDRGVPREGSDGGVMTAAAQATNGNILELRDVHTYYGSIHALKGISITVGEGEIVTLIGANGAGKSTTLRSINGLNRPRSGGIAFQGRDITSTPADQVVKMGISQAPEGRRLFPRMSVLENLEMGAFQRKDRSGI